MWNFDNPNSRKALFHTVPFYATMSAEVFPAVCAERRGLQGIWITAALRNGGIMSKSSEASSRYAHRQSAIQVRITRPDGTPAADVPVHFRQTRHAFLFGCGAFDAVPLASGQLTGEAKKAAEQRFERWFALFNQATLPFYWGRFEPEPGHTITQETLAGARFLNEHGVTIKGHPLCWHTVCAPWLMELDNETILKTQLARITREVRQFAGLIDMWDVINEAVIMPVFDKYDNAVTRICKEYGRINLIRMVFEQARQANPDATLLINDFNTSSSYEILVEGCLAAGVPLDVIGIQSHQHQGFWGQEKLEEVLDRFAQFGLPLHFTENTLTSGHRMPANIVDLNDYQVHEWPSTPEYEERQAWEMEQMYRTLFAHPLVEAIINWSFCDAGAWLHAPAGLLREDGTVKPAYNRLYHLIREEWWTEDTLRTDSDGCLTFTGFRGDYELTCGVLTTSFSLHSASAPLTLTLF